METTKPNPDINPNNNESLSVGYIFSSEYTKKRDDFNKIDNELDRMYPEEIKKLENYIKTTLNNDSINIESNCQRDLDINPRTGSIALYREIPGKGEMRVYIPIYGEDISLNFFMYLGKDGVKNDNSEKKVEIKIKGGKEELNAQLEKVKKFLETGEFPK